jgi:hypothetical protein
MLISGGHDEALDLCRRLQKLFMDVPGHQIIQGEIFDPAKGKNEQIIIWLENYHLWGNFRSKDDGKDLLCSFGCSRPQKPYVQIPMDVEINFKSDVHYRSRGRVFPDENGDLYFGHRGGLSGGGEKQAVTLGEFSKGIHGFSPQKTKRQDGKEEATFVIGRLGGEQFLERLSAYVAECRRLARQVLRETDADPEPFNPSSVNDSREKVIRSVISRRGQAKFRDALRKCYGDSCAITGCNILDLLEAAHITPFLGQATNNLSNGLLLRSDIHTLFDCYLLAIHPDKMTVVLHPKLRQSEYSHLQGKGLRSGQTAPSTDALKQHFKCCKFDLESNKNL